MLHRLRGLLAGCLLLIACSASHAAALPAGLEVRLEPRDGKTRFTLGEPIVLELVLSASTAGFQVNVEKGDVSEQVDVIPAEGWFRAHGVDHHDVVMYKPLTDTPLRSSVLLNRSIAFQKPGRYEVSVTTDVSQIGAKPEWLKARTNAVIIEIQAPDEAAEAEQVEKLVALIKAKTKRPARDVEQAGRELTYLGGDAAIRAKVALIVDPGCRCEGLDRLMGDGIASARNLPLQLDLLRKAWLDPNAPARYSYFEAMHNTRMAMRGEMIEGWQMVIAQRTDPAAVRASQEDAQDINDLIETLPKRTGESLRETSYLLTQLSAVSPGQLIKTRPYLIQTFGEMRLLQQSMVLSNRHWNELAGPDWVPLLQAALTQPRKKRDMDIGRAEILGTLIRLSAEAARPYVLHEACDATSRVDAYTLTGLPDETWPEMEACLTPTLQQWQGPMSARSGKAALLARYGSAAALPFVRELYEQRPTVSDFYAAQYEGALVAYLLRYAPDEALVHIKAHSGNVEQFLYAAGRIFEARHAHFPAEVQAWIRERTAQAASATGSSTASGLR